MLKRRLYHLLLEQECLKLQMPMVLHEEQAPLAALGEGPVVEQEQPSWPVPQGEGQAALD